MSVLIETSFGDIVIDLFYEEAPLAAKNFLKLCKIKYYNNCEFFCVDKGFIIQSGDPLNSGKGGRSVYGICYGDQADLFEDEIRANLKHDKPGIVSMAGSGENSNGSQFFITTGADLDSLDEKHTIFAEVAEGMETVWRIDSAFTDENKRPYQIIRIRHTFILHDPFPDPQGLPEPPDSPLPSIHDDPSRIAEDEVVEDDFDQERLEQLEEERKRKDARSRAEVLEIIGDIKSADMKPPENVLFVAKLNPVTEGEDLEIIFSRFGECKADIIKDKVTGDSLCYAFVEFEDKKACERAYFKMDNTLVDDRRIRVDFSQSVSRLWNNVRRGKRERIGRADYDFNKKRGGPDSDRHGGNRNFGGEHGMVFDTPQMRRKVYKEERRRGFNDRPTKEQHNRRRSCSPDRQWRSRGSARAGSRSPRRHLSSPKRRSKSPRRRSRSPRRRSRSPRRRSRSPRRISRSPRRGRSPISGRSPRRRSRSPINTNHRGEADWRGAKDRGIRRDQDKSRKAYRYDKDRKRRRDNHP